MNEGPDGAMVPPVTELLWPTLQAVRSLNDAAGIEEIDERVITAQAFSESLQAVLHRDGPRTEIEYRLAWARTYLKNMGLLMNSGRGIWNVTPDGRVATQADVDERHRQFRQAINANRKKRSPAGSAADLPSDAGNEVGQGEDDDTASWKDELLQALLGMEPGAFERLATRLLKAEGFTRTRTTPLSNDGGIDGVGVYRLSLVSFPVYFQCKRYSGSVGAGAVRDFRGAMTGRGDRGLLITTGSFTAEAKREATRDGAPPIDLIDGGDLCDLLRKNELGVSEVRRVEVQPEFFLTI